MTEPAEAAGPVVVDTMVFSSQFVPRANDRAPIYARHLVGRRVVLSFVTVEEIWFGAFDRGWGADRRAQVAERLERVAIAPYHQGLALEAARLRAECKEDGHPLHQKVHAADRWIAATARHLGLPLVTDDRIFLGTPGLELITEQER